MSIDTEAALATVRYALAPFFWGFGRDPAKDNALAALDTLASELERKDERILQLIEGHALQELMTEVTRLHKSIEGAMARINELEGELADVTQKRDNVGALAVTEAIERNKATIRLDRAVGALRKIDGHLPSDDPDVSDWAEQAYNELASIARTALAEIEESA